jgi:hypothetical protein
MTDTRWLTRLVDHTQIAATIPGPYISPVIVLRDPTGHHRLASLLLLHPGRRPR